MTCPVYSPDFRTAHLHLRHSSRPSIATVRNAVLPSEPDLPKPTDTTRSTTTRRMLWRFELRYRFGTFKNEATMRRDAITACPTMPTFGPWRMSARDGLSHQFCYRMGTDRSTELNECSAAIAAKVCATAKDDDQFSVNFTLPEKSHSCEFDLRMDQGYLGPAFKFPRIQRSPELWQKTRHPSAWQTWKS